jgi:hypothetical protein
MRVAILCALLAAGCGDDSSQTPAPADPNALRGPHGAQEVHCEGHSIDPPELEMQVMGDNPHRGPDIERLEALAGSHPGSSTVRARLGFLLSSGEADPERAGRWIDLALALHDRGCTLGEEDYWVALEAAALSRFMRHDYAGARPFLVRSLARFPSAAGTRYNLACSLCQTGDVDGCARELEQALVSSGQPSPEELSHHPQPPREHFLELAQEDPDLAPLRAQATRFDAILAPYR